VTAKDAQDREGAEDIEITFWEARHGRAG
jgi:hypothetical protein